MRIFIIVVVILAVLAGGIVWYLQSTTPEKSAGVRLPLTAAQRTLLASVPADADTFALIPTAAALHAELLANPVTREPVAKWADTLDLPEPWMIGGADVVVWKTGKRTSYAINLDPIRALLVRFYLRISGGTIEARRSGGTFLINATAGTPIDAARLDSALAMAAKLPPGHALVVQTARSRTEYPPIARPAVSTIQVTPAEIVITSRAASSDEVPAIAGPIRFARGAVLSALFADRPRILGDLDRLLGRGVSTLLSDGAAIAIYDVETGGLLPRPKGVIVVPADARRREAVKKISGVTEAFGEIRDTGAEIQIALDRTSLARYAAETFVPATAPAATWALRADASRLIPLLEKAGDSTGLRLAAPRVYRAARDLRRWVRYLVAAESIEAIHSEGGGAEELRVVIRSK